MLRPRDLPRLREQTIRNLTGPRPGQTPPADHGRQDPAAMDRLITHLRAAALYWATPAMAAQAVHGGQSLAAARWATTDRPAPCGLLHFDDGIGTVPVSPGVAAPVDSLLWGPHPEGLAVLACITHRRLAAHLERAGHPSLTSQGVHPAPLLFIGGDVLPVTAGPVPMATVDTDMQPLTATLAAAWRMMSQTTLVTRTREQAPKALRRNAARQGITDPDVTLIDLRRQYTLADPEPQEGATPAGGRYRHRWTVGGHWRTYRHARYSEEMRSEGPWWVPEYTKGPDGAPLLTRARVNVWRR